MYLIIYNKDNRSLSCTLLCTHNKSFKKRKFLSSFPLSHPYSAWLIIFYLNIISTLFLSLPQKKDCWTISMLFRAKEKNSKPEHFHTPSTAFKCGKTFSLSPSAVLQRVREIFVLSQYLLFVWNFHILMSIIMRNILVIVCVLAR